MEKFYDRCHAILPVDIDIYIYIYYYLSLPLFELPISFGKKYPLIPLSRVGQVRNNKCTFLQNYGIMITLYQ